jgi:NAD(P)-dependent dehydrogenase (short-subunit alcohol dehydrogenase family)
MNDTSASALVTGGAPGLIDTPIYGSSPEAEEFKAHLAKDVVFPKRLGRPGEYARMAWELIENPYVNGEVVRLDGAIRLPPK